jgi:hypothetical protein
VRDNDSGLLLTGTAHSRAETFSGGAAIPRSPPRRGPADLRPPARRGRG